MSITLTSDHRGLIIKTPYSSQFVSELKRLVSDPRERKFVGKPDNVWIVHPRHAQTVQRLIIEVYRSAVALPVIYPTDLTLTAHTLRLEYLGQCKEREDKSVSAFGHDGSGWNVIISESVLRNFFDDDDTDISVDGIRNEGQATKPQTLYQVLLLKQDATGADVKAAYRRLARQWHPDTCTEADAQERFIEIKKAYDLLSDAMKRKRYDAGLALEASLKQKQTDPFDDIFGSFSMTPSLGIFYRAPLRCGLLTIDGKQSLGRIHVSRILKWDDVIDAAGRVMVSSWNLTKQTYEIIWT